MKNKLISALFAGLLGLSVVACGSASDTAAVDTTATESSDVSESAASEGKLVASGNPKDIITPELMQEIYGMDSSIIIDPETGDPYVIPRSKAS